MIYYSQQLLHLNGDVTMKKYFIGNLLTFLFQIQKAIRDVSFEDKAFGKVIV